VDELRQAWEENAAAWVEWARAPGHDSYWRFHRDLFLELGPLTLSFGGDLLRPLFGVVGNFAGLFPGVLNQRVDFACAIVE